jgi:hypothetical protein
LAAIGSAAFLSVAFHGWPRALMSLPASLFLGWVAWRSRSTWPPLILHTVGTTAVLGALYAGGGYWRWSAGLTYGDVFILLGFGAVATLLGMRRLARSLSRRDSSRAIGASAAPPSGP